MVCPITYGDHNYVCAATTATAAEARILFELRPTVSWLSSSLFSIRGPCVCSSIFQKQFTAEIGAFRPKTKMENTLSAENENGRNHQK